MSNVRNELSSFQRRADRLDMVQRNRSRHGVVSCNHDTELPLPTMLSDDEVLGVGKTALPKIPSAIPA
jgi:hypothetical protein